MPTANQRNLNAALLVMLWIIAYALTVDSVFPLGDDLAHLVVDRGVPIPKRGLWVSNRVVDGFFAAFTFQTFEPLYNVLPGIAARKDFVDLFRAFNALIYSTALGCAALLLHRTVCKWDGKGRLQILFAWLVALCALFQWMPPNAGMTDLFAYQITAVITLGFLSITYPLSDLRSTASNPPLDQPFSRSKYLFLSLLAYLTAVGLEAFVAFAWLWILAHYVTSSRSFLRRFRTMSDRRSMFPSTFRGSLNRHTIALQFLLYSVWSIHALTTSGRTRTGLAAGPESMSWSNVADLGLMAIRSPGAQLLILAMVCAIGYCLLRRINVRGVARDKLIDRDTMVFLSTFSLIVGAGYLAGLVALGVVTRIDYVNDARLVFPLKFVLLAQLLTLSLSLLDSLVSETLKGVAVVVSLACSVAVLTDQMSLAAKQHETAEPIRDAFRRAALAQDEFVSVPFSLPNTIPGNEGYPLLPAAKAADWYRSSYRLMLNKYYGTHFDQSGPVFRAEDDTVAPAPLR
jgi:hypothetical protein